MKVVIAGAGIGGLTAALCLSRAGHAVHIVEQAPEFLDIGAGIQCGANAICVLRSLDVLEYLKKLAVMPERVEFCDYRSGKTLHTMTLGARYEQQYGAPYLHLHRSDLHRVLLEAFKRINPHGISMNANVESYSEHSNKVSIALSNGDQLDADLLVGADGIHSSVRKQMLGETPAMFTGNVAWRGVVPVDRLPSDWMDTIVANYVGPNKHMVLYYIRQRSLVNFVGVVENTSWTNSSWSAKAPWEELSRDFDGWHPSVRAVIDAVDKEQCYRWALYNHQPFDNWSTERVTLLGDAAHSTLPFMASGASMAIEDARILQRALNQASSLRDGLQLYQRNRYDRTARIQKTSTRAGKLYHFKSDLMRQAAFIGLKTISARQERYLPDYDANTVKLI